MRNGHAATAQALLAAGARVDRGWYCQELMLEAIRKGHGEIGKMLLDARRQMPAANELAQARKPAAQVAVAADELRDFCWQDMEQALNCAIRAGNAAVLQALLESDEGKRVASGEHKLLSAAVEMQGLDMVKALLAVGASPTYCPYSGKGPLAIAIAKGNKDIVEALLDTVGEVNERIGSGRGGPLDDAVDAKNVEMVRLLLARGYRGAHGIQHAFGNACLRGNLAVVQALLDAGASPYPEKSNEWEALSYAASGGNAELVAFLLKLEPKADQSKHANGNRREMMQAPLFEAASGRNTNPERPEVIRLLLQAGAKVNARDSSNFTVLMRAAGNDDTDVVRILLEAGADPNAWTGYGCDALQLARGNRNWTIEKLLQDWKPKPST